MKIILNIATHGDEYIGFKVATEIRKLNIDKNILEVQIANEKAFALKTRYLDQDLNRSFPGKQDGNYEEKRAYELSSIIKSADIVIDIHSTTSNLKDAIIVTKLDETTLHYVQAINPKYVLLMNATKDNALISQAKIGIAFEYGKDNNAIALKKTVLGIQKLLNYLNVINLKLPRARNKILYFDVFSTFPKSEGFVLSKEIKNYNLVNKGEIVTQKDGELIKADDDFYPLLFGFKGKRIDINSF